MIIYSWIYEQVAKRFRTFSDAINKQKSIFRSFFQQNSLQVEFNQVVNANNIVQWLQAETQKTPDKHDWIFIGRQLSQGRDKAILENPRMLNQIIDSTFSGFIPFFR